MNRFTKNESAARTKNDDCALVRVTLLLVF